MELLLTKTQEELIQEGIRRLDNTELNSDSSSGKICRLLLNIINSVIGDPNTGVYTSLRLNHVRALLSTADGEALNDIGVLLNCKRNVGEFDEEYRYRISKSTLTLATANETAIRLAALSVNGVQDVSMKPYVYGTGSFSVYVISEYSVTPKSILDAVKTEIDRVHPYGNKFEVLSPIVTPVELSMIITYTSSAMQNDKIVLNQNITSSVIQYINSRNMGNSLVIKDITNIAKDAGSLVKDAYIVTLKVDGRIVFITDQTTRWNQRFFVSTNPNAIIVKEV